MGRPILLVHTQSEDAIKNIIRDSGGRKTRDQAINELRSDLKTSVTAVVGAAKADTIRVLLVESFALRDGVPKLDEKELLSYLLQKVKDSQGSQ